jgi:hypothetical protein
MWARPSPVNALARDRQLGSATASREKEGRNAPKGNGDAFVSCRVRQNTRAERAGTVAGQNSFAAAFLRRSVAVSSMAAPPECNRLLGPA